MPLNSVNTNVGAATALRQFAAARVEQQVAERRIATGQRVNSARDSGAVWAIAQGQRSDIRGLSAVIGGLQRARSVIDVAIAAGESVSNLLLQMREKALSASDQSLDAKARETLNAEFVLLRDQITRVVDNADFDGLNLVDAAAKDGEIPAGVKAELSTKTKTKTDKKTGITTTTTTTKVQVPTLDLIAERLSLDAGNVTLTATTSISDPATISGVLAQLNASIGNVSTALARLGTMANAFERHQSFLVKTEGALQGGVGDLVDADLGRESARLQALQTRGQLGIQAMSIANGAPGVLLGLFRQ